MNILKDSNKNTIDKDVQWVTLSQDTEGQWVPQGPFPSSQVKKLMQQGLVKPTDYCWREGWTDWVRIYDEPSFYHSRKPPVEIQTVLKKPAIEFAEPKLEQVRFELAEPIKVKEFSKEKSKDKPMLEPWENKKALDFVESTSEELNTSTPTELLSDSLKNTQVFLDESKPETVSAFTKFKRPIAFSSALLVLALVLDFAFDGQISQRINPKEPAAIMVVSYISIQDYSPDLPKHLIARTDLKKDQNLVVRLLNQAEKPIRTIKGGAGLIIPSKGEGQIRIPLYPYDLSPGAYKIWVQAEGVEVIKEFTIPDAAMTSSPEA